MNNLEKTIWNLAMTGGSVLFDNGNIYNIDFKTYGIDQSEKTIGIYHAFFACEKGWAKPILHSLNKLTETVLEGGKVPALELADLVMSREKIDDTIKNSTSIPFDYRIVKKPFGEMLKITKLDTWILLISFSEIDRTKGYVLDQLRQWCFNIENLNPDEFIEKSTLKTE